MRVSGILRAVNVLYVALCLLCLENVVSKTAVAEFYNNGVEGTVKFTQENAASSVTLEINLTGLQRKAGGYHVHNFPVNFGGSGFILNAMTDGCSAGITSAHFNPLLVPGGAGADGEYNCAQNQQEACEAGDISGKFGLLTDLEDFNEVFEDSVSGLTLFGENSIIGRSVVIHLSSDSSRWVCATIREQGVTYKKIVSTFDEPAGLQGTVTFLQPSSDSEAETIVFANLKLGSEFAGNEAVELDWNLNEHFLFNRYGENSAKCSTASTGKNAKNLGKLELNKDTKTKKLLTFHNLPLFGEDSFASSSLTVRATSEASEFVSCSNLGKTATATFVADASNGVNGRISFTQASASDPVVVSVSIEGLAGRANGYHVHELPVAGSCQSTAGHFDPLNQNTGSGYVCTPSSPETCEAGDLSGRFGGFFGLDAATYIFEDDSAGLTLFGENSIVGRSVVIHETSNARMACTDIFEEGSLTSFEASFFDRSNTLSGEIRLIQREIDPDAETSVIVKLTSGDETSGHMFHVHETPVAGSGDCSSTEGHYNPQGLIGGEDNKNFGEYLCSVENFEFCEVGDLSGKFARLELEADLVFTDLRLPLTGYAGLVGRSITVHDEDGGSARIDCASLEVAEVTVPELPTGGSGSNDDNEDTEEIVESNTTGLKAAVGIFAIGMVLLALYIIELKTQVFTKEEIIKTRFENNQFEGHPQMTSL